ncbi:thiolase C-terminal domain-containing protein [Microbispora siamensis]
MTGRAFVAGVGMTKFEKIETRDWEYPDMVAEAVGRALADAGIGYDAVERAAAAVIVSERYAREHGLAGRAVEIVAQALTTDTAEAFERGSDIDIVGPAMTRAAKDRVFAEAGLGIDDVDVIELHDCFSINEILTYEDLGMCPEGEGGKLAESGATTYGGRWVVNPSGGLISRGHPLGATGLAQCAELTWQLRGEAGPRQVEGARVGLQHNLGLGGACVVTLYRGPAEGRRDDEEG